MEAQQVVEKILADAGAEAEKISKQAQEHEAAEQAKLDEQLGRYGEETQAIAKKAGADEKSHIVAAARMDIAKEYLAEKRKILDEVFEKARGQLKNLPDNEYRALCSKLMRGAVESGDEEVLVDKKEKRIDHHFIKQVNRELGPGYRGNLRLSEERLDLGGGFILRRGKIKTNISFKVLLDQARKELEIELANDLFGSQ
ncbi:MAG: V-type ATP synthase subunit E [Phycisphaerales bacterium]|nr:MAG: V-type ATP synthase subunit E [Phycisphaerales bacterium]